METFPKELNLSLCISCFNNILISAATTHVGKPKLSKKYEPWLTPHVRAKIHIHNHLRWTIHQNQEWVDAFCKVTMAINEVKTDGWKDLLQHAMSNSDGLNMWKAIQGANGTPDVNSPNEAMSKTIALAPVSKPKLTFL